MFIPFDLESSGALPAENYAILDVAVYFGHNDYLWLPVRHSVITLEPRAIRVNQQDVSVLDNDDRYAIDIVDKKLATFIHDHTVDGNRFAHQLVGFNVGSFDLSYLRAHMRRTYRRVHLARAYDLNAGIITLASGDIALYKRMKAAYKWYANETLPREIVELGPHHSLYDAAEASVIYPLLFQGKELALEILDTHEKECPNPENRPVVLDSESV